MDVMIAEICKTIMGRISSYELLNNLLPGAIYVVAVERLTDFRIFTDDALRNIIISYTVGLIIGRIGSLVIEELLKKIKKGKWLERVNYEEYVRAEKRDDNGQLRRLSMTNNAYRSLTATFVCILLTVCLSLIWPNISTFPWVRQIFVILGLIIVITVICFSYKKQTRYVTKRVKTMNKEP